MSKILPTVSLMLLAGFCAQGQQTQPPPKATPVATNIIPDEAVRQVNPVKLTTEGRT